MPPAITLTGITWNHTRGYLPLVATAQRFGELHSDVEIVWHKRSLQEFADYPIEKLAERFDLLVIDHPFVGYAAAHPTLLPLDEHLSPEFLNDQAAHSVGQSHASYQFGGHLWALAIDAATPVSSWRPDLLEKAEAGVPQTWDDLLHLAGRGLVTVPAIAVDSLMHFFMLCCGLGEEPFGREGQVVSREIGTGALEHLRELIERCEPACHERNPIATYEAMAAGDRIAYCPFAFGYSNYARPGYAQAELRFGGLVELDGRRLRSTLGGTGLAIARSSQHADVALEYAQLVASPGCQRGLYVASGGQPGHRDAWQDSAANAASSNYFLDTLETLDQAYLRPRYTGYIPFQDRAGVVVRRYLIERGDPRAVLDELDGLYRESLS